MNNSSYAQFAAEKVIAAADNEINRIKDISHESIVSTYNIFVPIWNADVEKANKPSLFDKIIGKLSKLAGKKHKHFEPAKIQNDSKKFREIETHIINECRRFTGEIKFPNLDFPPPRRDPMDKLTELLDSPTPEHVLFLTPEEAARICYPLVGVVQACVRLELLK